MRIWLADNLRAVDGGQLIYALKDNPDSLLIPPGVKNFSLFGYCSAQCSDGFPKEGINVIGGFLHTHLAGKASF